MRARARVCVCVCVCVCLCVADSVACTTIALGRYAWEATADGSGFCFRLSEGDADAGLVDRACFRMRGSEGQLLMQLLDATIRKQRDAGVRYAGEYLCLCLCHCLYLCLCLSVSVSVPLSFLLSDPLGAQARSFARRRLIPRAV